MSMRTKTIIVVILVFAFTIVGTGLYARLEARLREKEQQDMLKWQIPDDDVENSIKDYIDNIDWGSYIDQIVNDLGTYIPYAVESFNESDLNPANK